jgi:hypothetical protein
MGNKNKKVATWELEIRGFELKDQLGQKVSETLSPQTRWGRWYVPVFLATQKER